MEKNARKVPMIQLYHQQKIVMQVTIARQVILIQSHVITVVHALPQVLVTQTLTVQPNIIV